MHNVSRRRFLQWTATGAAAGLAGCNLLPVCAKSSAHVVIVGGGFGGTTAAKTLRLLDPNLKISLIEPKSQYITCPGSNWLFAGLTTLDKLTQHYQALSVQGINLIPQRVNRIVADKQQLLLDNNQTLHYDRLILSPGIDLRWNAIPGYTQQTAESIPHAWQAGNNTLLLQQQLQAIADGGVVMIYVPPEPYRCPPGPYERASMMACWLKQHRPKSKLIIVDAKSSFSKQKLFEAGWRKHFGYGSNRSLLEWHSIADNPLVELDVKTRTLRTDFGDIFTADVLNIIPPQQAAALVRDHDLTDNSGWCPVQPASSLSALNDKIHIIGDAANYAPLPKSAFAANSEAKNCALAVVSLLQNQPVAEAHWLNTCYSLITPEHGISVAGVYKTNATGAIELVKGAGGISDINDPTAPLQEAGYAMGVYRQLVMESFGG